MRITEQGRACCSIILGKHATWLETHTAQELRRRFDIEKLTVSDREGQILI